MAHRAFDRRAAINRRALQGRGGRGMTTTPRKRIRRDVPRELVRFGFFPKSTPLPTVGGLKAKSRRGDIGETWWSRRFLSILESFGFGSRLDRGRSYARRGQVLEWSVTPGEIRARVQGSRRVPYNVRPDFGSQRLRAGGILFVASLLVSEPSRGSGILIRQALRLGALHRFPLNQNALPLIALPRAAESHDHGAEPAGLSCASAQGGVAGRQEREMVQIGAGKAEWTVAVHDQHAPGTSALGAFPFLIQRLDHDQVRGTALALP